MKKLTPIVLTLLLVSMLIPASFANDSPVMDIPATTTVAEVARSEELGLTAETAVPVVLAETTTSEKLLSGIEILLFVDEELQACVPTSEVTYFDLSQKDQLTEDEQALFTGYYLAATEAAQESGKTLTNYFWIDIPDEYEELLSAKTVTVDAEGNETDAGEYLELHIVKTGTNMTCTVNGKEMEVEDLGDGTVILKLTETGAVAVFADQALSADLSLSEDASVPDVIPDPYTELLSEAVPALAVCNVSDDEQKAAVATEDVVLLPIESISQLSTEDQASFLQNFENVRDNPTDQKLRYFFWFDVPEQYEMMLSPDSAEGRYVRVVINIPGENPKVTVNGQPVELELVEGTTYALKLTDTGAIAVYSDPTAEETSEAASGDDWYRGNS